MWKRVKKWRSLRSGNAWGSHKGRRLLFPLARCVLMAMQSEAIDSRRQELGQSLGRGLPDMARPWAFVPARCTRPKAGTATDRPAQVPANAGRADCTPPAATSGAIPRRPRPGAVPRGRRGRPWSRAAIRPAPARMRKVRQMARNSPRTGIFVARLVLIWTSRLNAATYRENSNHTYVRTEV